MATWYDWFPERYDDELKAYERQGIAIVIDEDSRARGTLSLTADIVVDSKHYEIRVDYPSLFPFFQPHAFLENHQLARHHGPNGGHLCLLGRGTHQWSSSDNFADVLIERFPIILEINATNDIEKIKALEEPQGEPFTEYLNGMGVPGSSILYESTLDIDPAITMGMASLRTERIADGKTDAAPIVGHILEITKNGESVFSWSGPPIQSHSSMLRLPWVRLDKPPTSLDTRFIDLLTEDQKRHVKVSPLRNRNPIHFLVIFREEYQQFQFADGLAFVTIHPKYFGNRKKGRVVKHSINFQRTFRAGTADLAARMPAVAELQSKKIALFGLGALGSFAAVEFARAGVKEIRLVDFDFVEPATIRRWALGAPIFGQKKAKSIADHLEEHYPWTNPIAYSDFKIGAVDNPGQSTNQFDQLVTIIDGTDLIVDLTAEQGVNEILSMVARQLQTPYLVASATPGAWGGYVARFGTHHDDACWTCLTHDLYGDVMAADLPPGDPNGRIQPPGCGSLTFTGTSVDIQEISLEVLRQAFGVLTTSYPKSDFQLSIVQNRRPDGSRSVPEWTSREISKRDNCSCS